MMLRLGSPNEVGMSPQRVAGLANLWRGWVEHRDLQTIVGLVARRGVVVLHEAFGSLTPEADSPPATTDAIFPLASITKPITATAAMILVEEGKLGLHMPVTWYVPEFTGAGKDAVTPFHLMTHTSGIRDEDADRRAEGMKGTLAMRPPDGTQHPVLAEDLLYRFGTPLWKAPGKEMSYCSFGYNLLGEVIRRVSGMPLGEFAAQRIFGPLGMKSTSYALPEDWTARAVRQDPQGGLVVADTPEHRNTPQPSGGAWSTAADMAAFGQMFLNGGEYGGMRILSPKTVAAMTRNQIPGTAARLGEEDFPEASWGLGWSVVGPKRAFAETALLSPEAFCHGGAGGVILWVDPKLELVAARFICMLPRVPAALLGCCQDLFINSAIAAIVDD